MRTSIILSTLALVLVPTAAFADDSESPVDTGGYVVPHSIPYEGGKIPATATLESRPHMGIVVTGLGILGTAYTGSLIYGLATCTAQSECRAGSGWLYVPIVGPFVAAAQAPTTGGAALALFDGGVQVLGAALVITGLVWQKKFVVWQSKSATLKITPDSGSSGGPAGAVSGGVSVTLTHL
jgi:hypothetical protein